jgi:hypothetical protein
LQISWHGPDYGAHVQLRYFAEPHPHIVIDPILDPSVYAALRFPDHLVRDGAWGITASDPEYAEVMTDPVWRDLVDELCGEAFVQTVLDLFAEDLRRAGCLVDSASARLTEFVETREEKEAPVLRKEGDPNALFARVDFQSKGEGGYREFVHLDWARRITGAILFFSDADDEGLEGGELAMYRDRAFADDRWCHDPELVAMFRPRHNSGVIFLNSNAGFHGPRAIRKLAGRRRWLYYAISSQVDVWPHAPRVPS